MSSLTLAPLAPPAVGSSRRRRPHVAIVVGAILLLPPVVLLSAEALYVKAQDATATYMLRRAWSRARSAGPPASTAWGGAPDRPVARVVEPGVGLDAIVLASESGQVSDLAPTWMGSTDDASNGIVIVGRGEGWQRALARLDGGDIIVLDRLAEDRRHVVTQRYRVAARTDSPVDLDLPQDATGGSLLLVALDAPAAPGAAVRRVVRASLCYDDGVASPSEGSAIPSCSSISASTGKWSEG